MAGMEAPASWNVWHRAKYDVEAIVADGVPRNAVSRAFSLLISPGPSFPLNSHSLHLSGPQTPCKTAAKYSRTLEDSRTMNQAMRPRIRDGNRFARSSKPDNRLPSASIAFVISCTCYAGRKESRCQVHCPPYRALAVAISSHRVVHRGESRSRRVRQGAPVSALSCPVPLMPAYPMPACMAPYLRLMRSSVSASPWSSAGLSPSNVW